jgi:hypothetical protein
MNSTHRPNLVRLLQTTGLSLALMTASAVGVRAEDVTVQGANGVNGADGVNPFDPGQPGFTAGPTFADASSGGSGRYFRRRTRRRRRWQ